MGSCPEVFNMSEKRVVSRTWHLSNVVKIQHSTQTDEKTVREWYAITLLPS